MYLEDNYSFLPRYKCSYQLSISAFCQRGSKNVKTSLWFFSSHAHGDRSEVAFFAQSLRYKYMHASVQ